MKITFNKKDKFFLIKTSTRQYWLMLPKKDRFNIRLIIGFKIKEKVA